MLKSTIPNSDLIINTLIASEDHSSDRDFFNEKLLNFTVNNVVNNISDSEIYEYKPNLTNNINFNIFFLRYIILFFDGTFTLCLSFSKILPLLPLPI